MCLRTGKRSTTSAGVPSRPRLRLWGWRFPKASYTPATICSSASTRSACAIHASRRSPTSSAINPSPKPSRARRISITPLPPGLRHGPQPQQLMIELADPLHRLLQPPIVVQPAANLGDPFAADAVLAGAPAGVALGQDKDPMPLAARAF